MTAATLWKPVVRWVPELKTWVCGRRHRASDIGLWPCGNGDTPLEAIAMWARYCA